MNRRLFTIFTGQLAAAFLPTIGAAAVRESVPPPREDPFPIDYGDMQKIKDATFQPAIDLLNNDGMDIQVFVYDKDALPRVLRLIRMGQDVQEATRFHGHNDVLERDASISLERVVLLRTPTKRLHFQMLRQCVPFVTTLHRQVR